MRLRAKIRHVFLERRHRYQVLNHITLSKANALGNIRLLQRSHPAMGIIPVLKANAYGHGLMDMAEILNGADCDLLAVDGYFEAGKIRFVTRHKLLVLGYILPENVPMVDTKRCSFVVQDLSVLRAFGSLRRPVRIHLELNTGMNRLGIHCEELPAYLTMFQRYPLLTLEGVMTHLADADNALDSLSTDRQVHIFDECVKQIVAAGFRPRFVHAAQTAGSTKARSVYANALRLGIGMYGINPLAPQDARYDELRGLRPVLTLTSTIIKTLTLRPGEGVSYGTTFTASKHMRIGVLPLGYYEGIPRSLSNAGIVTHGTHQLPIVGRVCMNHTMISLEGTDLDAGDTVTVFSNELSAPNGIAGVCAAHQLFSYELLAKLSSSIRRSITS